MYFSFRTLSDDSSVIFSPHDEFSLARTHNGQKDNPLRDLECSDSEGSSDGHSDLESSVTDPDEFEEELPSRLRTWTYGYAENHIHEIKTHGSVEQFALSQIDHGYQTGSFYVTNLSKVMAQMVLWKSELPMVEPFYAVKCFPDPVVLKTLAKMGCNFDCATMGEMDLILNGLGAHNFGPLGKASTCMVYANPAKMHSHLEFAIANDVTMTVFDSEDELIKLASMKGHERLQLLMRIATDDSASMCAFSVKYGARRHEVNTLLATAKELGLTVAGVSFHVGSGCGDPAAYTTALKDTRAVFDEAERLGMSPMTIVDVGGGFPGDNGGYGGPGMPTFKQLAAAIREGIATFLEHPSQTPIRFIAEPGRYFVSECTHIVTKVFSRKGGRNNYQALYVDDGVYGSFNNVVYDHAHPIPSKLMSCKSEDFVIDSDTTTHMPSAVFGPTCDGLDQLCKMDATQLPRCEIGDWLIWPNCGAYTHTASYVFNGFTHRPDRVYCVDGL